MERMSVKSSMPKRASRIATALARIAVMSMMAVSLLLAGAGCTTRSTALDAGGSDGDARHSNHFTAQCSNGVAVPDPANSPGLVEDCATLLAAKDTLAGEGGYLNWSADVGISDWAGVSIDIGIDGVSELRLSEDRLHGEIPPELGNLSRILDLDLSDNQLTGEIPPELGDIRLFLSFLDLSNNQLTGEIPPELGNIPWLFTLRLSNNQLTGEIPPELGSLSRLATLSLHGNHFMGCIPKSLRASLNDWEIEQIGLSFCDATTATPVPGTR